MSTMLAFGGQQAQAQAVPVGGGYALGPGPALAQELAGQLTRSAGRGTAPTVALRVSAERAFTGQVNYHQTLASGGELVVGELQGVAQGSFALRIEGGQAEGHIVLGASRQAYRYATDARGQVTVQAVDIDKVVCVDYNQPQDYHNPAPAPERAANRTAVASLQSFPGARGCVMLDFDGQYVSGTGWNNGNPITAAPSGMSDAAIQEFWELVSEDYRPFSLNVTTDEAVFNTYPKNMRMRCIITPTNTAAPGAGGVAYVGSFRSNDDTPCWEFMTSAKAGGEAASHEVGHTLGLSHDGRLNPKEEYYDARSSTGNWAPIMGAGYYKPVTHWSKGEYNSASQTQDDLAIISGATYNVGYRNDDHANGTTGATALGRKSTSLSGAGIIERTGDQDFFSFTAGAGTVNLNVNTVGRHGDLNIVARLYNSTGGLIGTFDDSGLNTSLSVSVAAGTYYLSVDGIGAGNPTTDGYSDYASLGTFTISGNAPVGGTTPPPPTGATGVATTYRNCTYGGTAVALPAGDYSLAALQAKGIVNDDISSLKVNSGYEVQLFADDNFSGASIVIGASTDCLVASGWNDRASSLKVRTVAASVPSALIQIQAEAYTSMRGVQVEGCADLDRGQNVGYIDAKDWLTYNSVSFPVTGSYLIEYRVASLSGGGQLSADLNAGAAVLGALAVPNTGGWQTWTTISHTVTVTAGTYNLGVFASAGGWNLNWIRVSKVGAGSIAQAGLVPQGASLDQLATALQVYPNPATDRLMLASPSEFLGGQLRILSMEGKQVWHGTYSGEAVDVSGLKSGLYTLVAYTQDHHKLVTRFSKQ